MAEWQPNNEELQSTFRVLQALRDPSRPDHVQAMQSLDSFCANASFILHLLYVFVRGQTVAPTDIRALGGFILKNYGLAHLNELPAMAIQMLKSELLSALQDPVPEIQNTAGIIFGKLTHSFPVELWGDILPHLFSMLDFTSQDQFNALDGALQAVKRICEDSCNKLLTKGPITAATVTSPLDALVPKLLNLFQNPVPSIRLRALQSMNALLHLIETPHDEEYGDNSPHRGNSASSSITPPLGHGREAFIIHINAFLAGVSNLAADPQTEVRVSVCEALVLLASYQLAVLQPAFESICKFMLNAVNDPAPMVAIEACEFFAVLIDNADARPAVSQLLPSLLPILVGHLKLSNEQLMQERADEEAAARGDKSLNIRPVHHKVTRGEEDDVPDSGPWTLRKEAALLVDNISQTFPSRYVLPSCLGEVQRRLASEDAWDQEAGLLALGALGSGCVDDMHQYLDTLFPFFLKVDQIMSCLRTLMIFGIL